mmetsp:Transcript_8784/g.39967  ORF Transcript_8784/g.39967 Transcript_8784/m.39967 type:complete len:448 (+) Transcript_8784:5640-6983(+)
MSLNVKRSPATGFAFAPVSSRKSTSHASSAMVALLATLSFSALFLVCASTSRARSSGVFIMTPTAMSGGNASIIAAAPAPSSDAMYGTIAATSGESRPPPAPAPADASSTCRTSSPDIPSRHAAAAFGSKAPRTAAASDADIVDAHMDPSEVAGLTPRNTSDGQHLNRLVRCESVSLTRPVPLFAASTMSDMAADASSGFIAASVEHAAFGFSLQSSARHLAWASGDAPAMIAAHSSPVKSDKMAPAVPSGHVPSISPTAFFCASFGKARSKSAAALPSWTSAFRVPATCEASAFLSESASLAGGTPASAGARDLASASFPPHGGGTHAMLSRVPFPSGIPMSDRCRGAYAVELRRLPPGVVTRPGMPPGSEKATSAASALSCVMVLALRSMRSRRASSSLASSSSSTATLRKCMLRSTTTPWIPALPLPSHSSPSTSVTMSPCANR